MFHKLFILCLLLTLAQVVSAQTVTLRGTVRDAATERPIPDAAVVVTGTGKVTDTDKDGKFRLTGVDCSTCTLSVTSPGYEPFTLEIKSKSNEPIRVAMKRLPSLDAQPGDIPTITLEEAEAQSEGMGEVANLLVANRDVFQMMSGFGWSPFRFRERGYDGVHFQTYVNGMPFNDLESGFTSFGEFGGLNDVLRIRNTAVGLDAAEFAFGGIGGATFIDTRASVQRKQIRASYAISNRTYRNRVMLTANTGLMPGGWAVSLSGSKRWAQEGYSPGTFFDGYSYFLSVDKKFNPKHSLNLVVFGAPTKRGRAGDTFQEMYDLAGSNYYNAAWGYWNGEKRNVRTDNAHQPTAMLRYDWSPSDRTTLTATAYGQTGHYNTTRGNFIDGRNPAPDFNRRLPSSLLDPEQAAAWAELLRSDENLRQIDWAELYESNLNNTVTINDAEGQIGNSVTGRNSIYLIGDERSENDEAGANIFVNHTVNTRITLNGGAQYQWYRGQNYKVVDDLLGGDFFTDWDFFGNFDGVTNPLARNSDLQNINNIVREGEIFGWNYDENIRRANGWAQVQFSLPKFQFFAGGEGGQTSFWRTGYMQSGRFPDNSLGDSEKISFTTYGVKGGATWKMNGRNYLYANGYYGTRAPQFRNVFFAPRTRDLVVPNVEVSKIQSLEGGYILRAPNYRARLTGYLTNFENETEVLFPGTSSVWSVSRVINEMDLGSVLEAGGSDAFLEQPNFFGSVALEGINRRHVGMEAAIEAKPFTGWVFTAAASVGQFIYTNRPNLLISLDAGTTQVIDGGVIYQEDFYVPRTPQTAGALGVKYESRRFWFASMTLNYAGNFWYEFDRVRRTSRYVSGLTPDEPIWRTIIDQQEAPSQFTLDFFGGKSWRIKRDMFLYLNVGVSNILDNQDIVISGRETYRNVFRNDVRDPRFYASELFYAFGRNYFIMLALRI